MFGCTIIALKKKTGGLRPIDIAYYWRRLEFKCAKKYMRLTKQQLTYHQNS